jgi:transposase
VSNLYYRWSKDFLEAGKKRLQGDTTREASSGEVVGLRQENEQLKQLVAELSLKCIGSAEVGHGWAFC